MPIPRTIDSLPGPYSWPLIGNTLQLDPFRTYQILKEWSQEYGSFYQFRIGRKTVLALSDVEAVNAILKQRPERYRRWSRIEELAVEVGADGVFIAEQERWRQHRKIVTYALSRRTLKPLFARLQIVTRRLFQCLDQAARQQRSLDLGRYFSAYTTDIVSGLVFGEDLNTLQGQQQKLQSHLKTVFHTLTKRQTSSFPYWRYLKLPSDREADHALGEIHRLIGRLIERTREDLQRLPERADHPTNIIESLVSTQNKEGGKPFSDGEIIGNVLTLLLAGEDTTAHTLTWAAHFLISRPDIQEQLREEVCLALGDHHLPAAMEPLERLPYLEAVVYEAMRLKPVFPLFFLEPLEDVAILETPVPSGTTLVLLGGQMGQQAECFSDPHAFRPERWLEPESQNLPLHDVRGYLPFGTGSRICPGKFLAMLEIKMALAMLVKNFALARAPAAPEVREHFSLTLAPSSVLARLQRRPPGR